MLTVWLAFGHQWGLWPWQTELNPIWSVTFGSLGTFALGYGLSFVLGPGKSRDELAGLVLGVGQLGVVPAPLETAVEDRRRWA